jgi:hypothetical protein
MCQPYMHGLSPFLDDRAVRWRQGWRRPLGSPTELASWLAAAPVAEERRPLRRRRPAGLGTQRQAPVICGHCEHLELACASL